MPVCPLLEDGPSAQHLYQLGLCEIIKLGPRLDLVRRDVIVHIGEQRLWQVIARVDATVVRDELRQSHLLLDLWCGARLIAVSLRVSRF